ALVPTKKSFPPRTVIVILGTMFGLTLAMTWVAGKTRWDAVDASDPRKTFASEVFTTAQARLPLFMRNGNGKGSGLNGNGARGANDADLTGAEQFKRDEPHTN